MKKYLLFASGFILIMFMLFSNCKSKSTQDPCNGTGKLCIENKMDSTVVVNIVQKHQQITLQKDYMECLDLETNIAYIVSVSGAGYSKPDTTFLILPCDNKLFVIK